MDIHERLLCCRLIEEMGKDRKHAEKLGLENASSYRGKRVKEKAEKLK